MDGRSKYGGAKKHDKAMGSCRSAYSLFWLSSLLHNTLIQLPGPLFACEGFAYFYFNRIFLGVKKKALYSSEPIIDPQFKLILNIKPLTLDPTMFSEEKIV